MELKVLIVGLFCVSIASAYGDDVVINNRTFNDVKVGVATAAFQIEGAWNEDGKGEQIWDWFMHTYPERMANGTNGDVACDAYHKWREDIQLMKDLGVDHYRLSIAWSRILPDGTVHNNSINQAGIDYYRSVIQALLDANITPYVTLYHWDLPLPLHELGGWMNPVIADHFAAYARICFEQFGDLVKNWFTINEPATYCNLGYESGAHAPGYSLPGHGIYKCAYTTLLAHAKAYRIYESEFKAAQRGRVAIVINAGYAEANSTSTKDQLAVDRDNAFSIGLYAHPVFVGNWPQTVIDIADRRSAMQGFPTSRLPKFTDEEIELIKGTSDFFPLNTYATYLTAHQNDVDEYIESISFWTDKGTSQFFDPNWTHVVDWVDLQPLGFRKLINYVYNTYGQPEIIVTENGWADITASLNDSDRITYIKEYLSALLDARYIDGINVTGYTIWSIMDNLEWTNGFTQKLGLVQVDFNSDDRTRTPKDSYRWLQTALSTRCLLDDATQCVPS